MRSFFGLSAKRLFLALGVLLCLNLPIAWADTPGKLPSIDRFGQNADEHWPGKVLSEREAVEQMEKETASLRPAEGVADIYGGMAGGPRMAATGRFRTQKLLDRWWLVTPEGHLFYSIGVNIVQKSQETAITGPGRQALFKELPPRTGPAMRFFGINVYDVSQRTFDFYRANLELYKKSGDKNGVISWRKRTLDRMIDWGFNTIGNWSEFQLFRMKRLPYTGAISIFEPDYTSTGGCDYLDVPTFGSGKYRLADVFSPEFRKHVLSAHGIFSGDQNHSYGTDPWCIGVFVDNEIPWTAGEPAERHALVRAVFAKPGRAPAKTAFWRRMAKRYKTLEDLNRSWGTSFTDGFDQLEMKAVRLPETENDVLRSDLEDLTWFYADRHFTTVRKAFHRFLPKTLFLGCRFDAHTPVAIRSASAKYADVISINTYERNIADAPHVRLELDKPMLVSEFSFGAADRGAVNGGMIWVRNQGKRAKAYRKLIDSILKNPAFVGYHWFEYADQPVTGRLGDGENGNCGLVNVLDLAYPELTQSAAKVNRSVYERLRRAL